jgi:hypothetical protein
MASPLGNVITIDDERTKNHLDRVVRGSVEETLDRPAYHGRISRQGRAHAPAMLVEASSARPFSSSANSTAMRSTSCQAVFKQ